MGGDIEAGGGSFELTEQNIADITAAVWSATERTITEYPVFTVLVAQQSISAIATAVWGVASRGLTTGGITQTDINSVVTAVWNAVSRSLTTNVGATLTQGDINSIASAVWAVTTRTLTSLTGLGAALESTLLAVKGKTDLISGTPATDSALGRISSL